jgi:hypothetical protein
MLKDCSTLILRRIGTGNTKNIQPKTASTVPHADVGNGSNLEICTRKMVENMGNAAAARQKFAASVMVDGMVPRTVRRMRRRIDFLKQQNKLAGSDAITVGRW